MYVLGIETSCDETSAAIVKDGKTVLSNIISSSLEFHKKYGGVIPEIAFRKQLETIAQVTESAVKSAKIRIKDIGLVAVTNTPGLLGSLLVGISFAKSVSYALKKPLLGVNHLYSHIYASLLNEGKIRLPFVGLIVSGGHTSLYFIENFDKITLLGSTQDDACGEAFDKSAKILGLGYPGGPVIEKRSLNGDPDSIKFKCSETAEPLDFSFSGIKTAVLYYRQKNPKVRINNICASFQKSVIDVLVQKSLLACKLNKTNRLVIGGGVAANNKFRESITCAARKSGIKVYFPAKLG